MDNFSEGGLRLETNELSYKKYGLTLAKVTNITDPDGLSRVTCKPVADEGDEDILETDWCHVVTPLSGAECGQFFLPSVGDLVLLAYLNADPHCPYVIGGVWDADSAAPYALADGNNYNFSIKTPSGCEFIFYDEPDKQYMTLTTPSGASIKMNDETKSIIISDPEATNSLTLDWEGKKLSLLADEEISLTCGEASITLKSDGTIDIAGKTVNITGTDIKAEATNGFEATGATAKLEASGQLSLSGATADLKGSSAVNIN